MSRRLGVPVTVDASGWLRCGVELRFHRGAGGTIQPVGVRVGAKALVDDVLALGDIFGRTTRYNELLGSLRRLRDQLEVLVRGSALLFELARSTGTQFRELLELDELISRRQSKRMGHRAVRVDNLDLEITFLRRHHARLADAVAQARAARAAGGAPRIRTSAGEGGSVDVDE